MLVPTRNFSSTAYRFGFNGKEKDDEVKGSGMQIDYGFRIYDSRAGRFLSVDPLFKSFPWYTPYQFASNTPIQAIDLDGLESKIVVKTNDGDIVLKYTDDVRNWKNIQLAYSKAFTGHSNFVEGKEEYGRFDKFGYKPSGGTLTIDATGKVAQVSYKKGTISEAFVDSFYLGAEAMNVFFIHPDPLVEGSKEFQNNMKNTALASIAVVAAPISIDAAITAEMFTVKAGISALSQYTINDGKVNLVGVFSDGLLFYQSSSIFGAAFEVNIDFNNDFEFTTHSIFFDKSFKNFTIEASVSALTGFKTSSTSNFLSEESKKLGSLIIELSNQFANYGLQKEVKKKNKQKNKTDDTK